MATIKGMIKEVKKKIIREARVCKPGCLHYPAEKHFMAGGSMAEGCKWYMGYGCCSNKYQGKKIEPLKLLDKTIALLEVRR